MEHTILLFGFDSLPEILAAQAAAGPFGTEVRAVGPRDCGLTIGELAAGKTAPDQIKWKLEGVFSHDWFHRCQ